MNYAAVYSKVLRYSAGEGDVRAIASQMTPHELAGQKHAPADTDWNRRLVLADALRDQGRDQEADHVGNLETPLHLHPNGQFERGVARYRDVLFHQDVDADDHINHINTHGPSATIDHLLDTYDNRDNQIRVGGSGVLWMQPAHNDQEHHFTKGSHTLSWAPDGSYVNLQERHILPESHADHNSMLHGETSYNPRLRHLNND